MNIVDDASEGTGATWTLHGVLQERAGLHPERPFVSFPDEDLTYGELFEQASRVARGLLSAGLRPGGHVGILMPNTTVYVALMFGIYLAGGVAVPINARFKRRELSYVIAHSDVEILVTTDLVDEYTNFTELVGDALANLGGRDAVATELHVRDAPRLHRIYVHGTKSVPFAEPFEALIEAGHGVDDETLERATSDTVASDIALLLYTSGTTANPKGCLLTHDALLRSWSAYADLIGLSDGESIWTPLPFFHVGGIGVTVSALVRGATMMSMTHFDPETTIGHLERLNAEHLFPAFPPITLGLLRSPGFSADRLKFVRTVLNVAPADTQIMMQNMLPDGAVLLTDFGMTEGAGMITATALDAANEDRLERNGTPLPGIEVRVSSPDNPESVLPHDTPGEIQFRGINAFKAYYKDEDETAATILPGGWVRTGDLGSLNSRGSLLFLGRIKDVLKVGGENVTPLEVEAHLSTHPAVQMVQVVGRPSEKYGEEPVAFVELAAGAECTADDLIEYCRGQLASFKVPREVRFVTSWPMSATKIQKFKLRELLSTTSA